FLVAIQNRPVIAGQVSAVHPQLRIAALGSPGSQFLVDPLARYHDRRQDTYLASAPVLENAREDHLCTLRFNGHLTARAVLGAQLDEDQAQEVVDLSEGGHRALAA